MSPRRAWILCILLFCAAALCFIDRQVLSILAPQIIAEFGMNNTVYGRIVSAYVMSYMVMALFGGRLMDALGTRRGLGYSVTFWSLASAAHALVTGPVSLGVARFFLGVGEGPCFPGTTKGAIEWMDAKRRGFAVGFANSGGGMGIIIAPPLVVWAASHLGWRGAFAATAGLGLIWVIAWHLAFRGLPTPSASDRRAGSGFRALLARPEVRRLMAARFFFDPVFYFYMFWIPQYLSRERGMSTAEIGALVWIPFVALEISNIGAGSVSDSMIARGWNPRRARLTLMLVAALLTPASWLAVLASTPAMALALMAVLLFAHGIWIANFMTLIGDTVATEDVATTVGLTAVCGGLAGMISSQVIGYVVDHHSFGPVFFASALVYPIAWIIIRTGKLSAAPHARPSEAS